MFSSAGLSLFGASHFTYFMDVVVLGPTAGAALHKRRGLAREHHNHHHHSQENQQQHHQKELTT